MGLLLPNQITTTTGGIRPFAYVVEFAADPANPTQPANPNSATLVWTQRLTKLNSVQIGYGSGQDQQAMFSTWDAESVPPGFTGDAGLIAPVNGDVIRVTVQDFSGNTRVIFKGTVRQVLENNLNSGIIWNATAFSEAIRLDEVYFTGKFNPYEEDPTQSNPHFDVDGQVQTMQYTLKNIIDTIMDSPDAWATTEYFLKTDIDWGGLDTEPRCGLWIPRGVKIDNAPKGRAILDLLRTVGNFTLIYVPGAPGVRDKLRMVELNSSCAGCGYQWNISFAPLETGANPWDVLFGFGTTAGTTPYAYDYVLARDSTTWESTDSFNTVRVVTGPIEFYSANMCIPEMVTDPTGAAVVAVDQDTVANQIARAPNFENCFYRFINPATVTVPDVRDRKQYFVGMPLFPDWNIFEDWLPALFEIGDVIIPPTWTGSAGTQTTGPAPAAYNGLCEFQPTTIGHQATWRKPHLSHLDNLRAYQAWQADQKCPACNGQGLVKSVYNGNNNEPNITITQKGPSGGIQRPIVDVTNHIMPPSYFGMAPTLPITLSDGTQFAAVGGGGVTCTCTAPAGGTLVPFYDSSGNPDMTIQSVASTHGYPLPWKNTCPFCRGVGMWPKYKIRNICQELISGRNLTAAQSGPIYNVSLDPDATQSGPETWEMANNRLSIHGGPQVQVESGVMGTYCLPEYTYKNLPYKPAIGTAVPAPLTDLDHLPDGSGNPATTNLKRWAFPHPLQYQNTVKLLTALAGVTVQRGDAARRDQIVPDSFSCAVPFTTISMEPPVSPTIDYKMGRIIFPEAVFIPCWMDYSAIQISNSMARVDTTGLLMTGSPARGYETSDSTGQATGYWRPARVWMTFGYFRDKYYHSGITDPNGNAIAITEFQADPYHIPGTPPDPSGSPLLHTYQARAMVIDGCYAMEVRLKSADCSPPSRVICRAFPDERFHVKATEADFWKLLVPLAPDQADTAFAADKVAAGCTMVNGRILRWMRTSPGEAIVEMEGYTDADHYGSVLRPKVLTWTLRDDRSRIMGHAIRILGLVNNTQVKGQLDLIGMTNDLSTGLGWVNYPNKGTAAVIRVTYNFSNGFQTEIELHREETRIGEMPIPDQQRQDRVNEEIANIKKTIDVQKNRDREKRSGSADQQIDGTTISKFITGGI